MILLWAALAHGGERCTYEPLAWEVETGRSVALEPVDKPRSALSAEERGPLGCTPCSEDQRTVTLADGTPLTACKAVVEDWAAALDRALAAGATFETVSGYRPVRSRGPVDEEGRRTVWSDHAFGLALALDPAHNGLYTDCLRFGPTCRRVRGGPWDPANPRSLTPTHPAVRELTALGLRWGGALEGQQKDFMHFAPPADPPVR